MTSPGQCIAVASGKGGTGKTSFTAGVGAALALSGRRVLCLDCDIGLRNLDLALGLSDRTLMDFSDVAQNRCSLELAAVEHPKIPGLFLLTAPARPHGRPVTEIQMADLLREVRRRFDFCLLDAPAGLGRGFQLATCAADRCVVVTCTDASSLRDAQHTVMELRQFGSGRLHLGRGPHWLWRCTAAPGACTDAGIWHIGPAHLQQFAAPGRAPCRPEMQCPLCAV